MTTDHGCDVIIHWKTYRIGRAVSFTVDASICPVYAF